MECCRFNVSFEHYCKVIFFCFIYRRSCHRYSDWPLSLNTLFLRVRVDLIASEISISSIWHNVVCVYITVYCLWSFETTMAWCPNNICCSVGQWIAVTLCWECLFDYFVLVTLYMSLTSVFIIDQSARACTICYFNLSVMCSPIKYDASFSLASFFFFLWSYQRSSVMTNLLGSLESFFFLFRNALHTLIYFSFICFAVFWTECSSTWISFRNFFLYRQLGVFLLLQGWLVLI